MSVSPLLLRAENLHDLPAIPPQNGNCQVIQSNKADTLTALKFDG